VTVSQFKIVHTSYTAIFCIYGPHWKWRRQIGHPIGRPFERPIKRWLERMVRRFIWRTIGHSQKEWPIPRTMMKPFCKYYCLWSQV